MAALVLLLIACVLAAAGVAVYQWVCDYGVPMTVAGLDATCRFLLCYETPAEPVADTELAMLLAPNIEAEEYISWATEKWPADMAKA